MTVPTIIYGTRCQVYVQPSGSGASTNAVNFAAEITEISESGGERAVETVKTLGNNEVTKESPQADKEIEIVHIVRDVRFAEAVMGGSAAWTKIKNGAGFPIVLSGDSTRLPYRVWVEASGTAADDWMTRLVWSDSYGISYEKNVDAEGHLEGTLRLKCKSENYTEQWTGSYTTHTIAALPTY